MNDKSYVFAHAKSTRTFPYYKRSIFHDLTINPKEWIDTNQNISTRFSELFLLLFLCSLSIIEKINKGSNHQTAQPKCATEVRDQNTNTRQLIQYISGISEYVNFSFVFSANICKYLFYFFFYVSVSCLLEYFS